MKNIVIHQPDFIPHIGFFHRLLSADEFIVLDHVRISKSGWVHRDKIKTANKEQWITLPVKKIGEQPKISEAQIDYNAQYDKILRVIQTSYQSAPFFNDIFPSLEEILGHKPKLLLDLNLELLKKMMSWFAIDIPMISSRSLGVETTKLQMNIDLIKAVGGTTYIAGVGSKSYHEDDPFKEANIAVVWHAFNHPVYPQQFGEFIPYLSSIDLLFNCGLNKSQEIVRSCL